MKKQSFSIALCGVFGALSIVVMLLGVIIPIVHCTGRRCAAGDDRHGRMRPQNGVDAVWRGFHHQPVVKEVAFVYVFLLGYYPLVKPRFDAIRRGWARAGAKLLFFNLALAVAYGLLILLLFPGFLATAWQPLEILTTAAVWLMGNLAFILFDKALVSLLRLYQLVWKRRLHRMLRH